MANWKGMDCGRLYCVNLVKLDTIPSLYGSILKLTNTWIKCDLTDISKAASHYSLKVTLGQGSDKQSLPSELWLHTQLCFPHTDPAD